MKETKPTLLPSYKPLLQVTDPQPIRATCFHPSGEAYVVGSNSKALKICRYPDAETRQSLLDDSINSASYINQSDFSESRRLTLPIEPEILFTCLHIHCGSVYCASFNRTGNLLATGSNDQIVHLIRYNSTNHSPEGSEYKLAIHSGTIRDICFLAEPSPPNDDWARESTQQSSNLLASAGAGEFEINISDCDAMKCIQSFRGHEAAVMSLHSDSVSGNTFVSGSSDGTIRLWDTRSKTATSVITKQQVTKPLATTTDGDTAGFSTKKNDGNESLIIESSTMNGNPSNGQHRPKEHSTEQSHVNTVPQTPSPILTCNDGYMSKGVPVGCVRMDPSGRLLVSGHQDGVCMLYDIRAGKEIQSFQAHQGEIRALNFSPKSYYLLTGGYDRKVKLIDLQGSLISKPSIVEVAELGDKCVQAAWHPFDYNFVTTCANGSATLWTIPKFEQWIDSVVMD